MSFKWLYNARTHKHTHTHTYIHTDTLCSSFLASSGPFLCVGEESGINKIKEIKERAPADEAAYVRGLNSALNSLSTS